MVRLSNVGKKREHLLFAGVPTKHVMLFVDIKHLDDPGGMGCSGEEETFRKYVIINDKEIAVGDSIEEMFKRVVT